jgi:hypothetical protein
MTCPHCRTYPAFPQDALVAPPSLHRPDRGAFKIGSSLYAKGIEIYRAPTADGRET